MNTIKPLITNDDISVDEKFRSNRQVANNSNYMLFSNHHDALALTPNDRRYFVVKSPLQSKAQILALGDGYFSPLYEFLRDKPGAMRAFLLDWEISANFQADGHAPRTTYVAEMVNDSAGDIPAAVRRMLLEGDFPLLQYDIVSGKTVLDALTLEGLTRATPQQVAAILREEGLQQIGRHLLGGERHYLWMRAGMDAADVLKVAAARLAAGSVNLAMELVYT